MARGIGDTGKATVLNSSEVKRLLKIASTTMHGERDQTVITLSYGIVRRKLNLVPIWRRFRK